MALILNCLLLLWQRDVHPRVHAGGPCVYTRCGSDPGYVAKRLGHVCRATALCSDCRTWTEPQVARAACLQHVMVKVVLCARTEWLVAGRHVDCCNASGSVGCCQVGGDASQTGMFEGWQAVSVRQEQQSLIDLATGCSLCCQPAFVWGDPTPACGRCSYGI